MSTLNRRAYAEMYGPTTGDRVRLADTDLMIEVEKDFAVYGDEVKFGGGKVIRDGMGQSQRPSDETVDTVITNALIVDHWGIVKADVGIKTGRIADIGKEGNPDTQPDVDVVNGHGKFMVGENLDRGIEFAPGDYLFIPPGAPHPRRAVRRRPRAARVHAARGPGQRARGARARGSKARAHSARPSGRTSGSAGAPCGGAGADAKSE